MKKTVEFKPKRNYFNNSIYSKSPPSLTAQCPPALGFYLNPMTTETLSEIQVSYKPGLTSSKIVNSSKEAFDILATLFPQ